MLDEAVTEDESVDCHLGLNKGCWSSAQTGMRNKLESEDSSYDSDYENSEPLASPKQDRHQDVSRTVSDTLAAEFEEYVGLGCASKEVNQDVDIGQDVCSDPEYTSRIEFALKLGYTVKQARVALQKLGPKAQQNELLAELIKLGACNQQKHANEGTKISSEPVPNPVQQSGDGYELRSIVIDGSNVAMSHGNKEVFSCRGIKLCVDWFKARGHRDITVFVPLWRKEASRPDAIIKDQEVLWELEKEKRLVFTPSRQIGGRRMACHEDRYILKLAAENDGIVVSNDNYRDLINESPDFKKLIEERLLMYSFVNDRFMPPDDPLGRHGPSLDNFLCVQKKAQEMLASACPYKRKCTYGNKCKYYHPERGNQPQKSVSEQLAEQAKISLQEHQALNKNNHYLEGAKLKPTLSSPFPNTSSSDKQPVGKKPLQRTQSLHPADSSLRDMQLPSPLTKPMEMDQLDGRGAWSSQFYGDGNNHLSVAKRLSDPDSCKSYSGDAPINSHQKLQRQLTLNPVYDARLFKMKGFKGGDQQEAKSHMPLMRHSSEGITTTNRAWRVGENHHQSVSRIASAPDSYHQWHPTEMSHHQYMWGMMAQPTPPPQMLPCNQIPAQLSMSFCEKRNHLYYHLSSIFNSEQVRAAMDAHPEETDPQAICAAILKTFQHSS